MSFTPYLPPMRVLHLIDSTGPGGAETVFARLVTGLPATAVESIAVLPLQRNAHEWSELGRNWLREELRRSGCAPIDLPTLGSFDWRHVLRLARLAKRREVDLIHAHQITANVYGALAGFAARVPVVCTFHGENDVLLHDRLRKVKFALLNRGAARLVFVSEALRETMLARTGLRRDRAAVVHNGVDPDAMRVAGARHPMRQRLGIGPDELVLGAIGNLRPAKGYDVLVRTVARLRGNGLAVRCMIVGEASEPLHSELLALSGELGVTEDVQFLGFRQDVPALLQAMDVFVVSSTSEGFSLAAVQAMAAERPVIATRCGGPEEIVTDGRDGILVPVADDEALATAVAGLVGHPQERERLAANGVETVRRRFSLEAMIRRYRELYSEVTEPRSRRPSRLPA